MAKLGWIGMGEIGSPMVLRLLRAGHEVTVWGRRVERLSPALRRGAQQAGSAAEVAAASEAVFLCVTDGDAVDEVLFASAGVADGASSDTLVVDHSTIHPERSASIASRLSERGLHSIDAPVSGGAAGARAGTLIVLAGGEPTHVDHARPWMEAYARRVAHLGGHGAGQMAKSCSQALLGSTLALWAEVLGYAQRSSIDVGALIAALEGSWSDSAVRRHMVPHMLSGRFQGKSIRPLLDDLDIVADVARTSGAPMPITSLAISAMRQQIAQGEEMRGLTGLVRLYTEPEAEPPSPVEKAAQRDDD